MDREYWRDQLRGAVEHGPPRFTCRAFTRPGEPPAPTFQWPPPNEGGRGRPANTHRDAVIVQCIEERGPITVADACVFIADVLAISASTVEGVWKRRRR